MAKLPQRLNDSEDRIQESIIRYDLEFILPVIILIMQLIKYYLRR
jgi:hypothetical protein